MKKINTHQIIEMIIKDNLSKKNHEYYSKIFPKLTETQIVKMLSKFKSRYEIAYYMTDININNIEKTPFAKNNRERLKSYSSMIKFFLTYSAFEYFGKILDITDDIEFYNLIEDKDTNQFIKSLDKNIEKISNYCINNVDSKYLIKRIKIFIGSELNDTESNKIKSNLYKVYQSKNSLKYKDILCLPRAMRHQIAHGKFVATYSSADNKTYLKSKDMIEIYNSFNKLLFKIIDKKFHEIFNNSLI